MASLNEIPEIPAFLIALVFHTMLKVDIFFSKYALDFESQVILSERSKNMT